MAEDLLSIAQLAVEQAKAAGAGEAWAGVNRSRSVDVLYRNGKLETSQESVSRSLTVEIWKDGRYAAHTTTDLRPDRLSSFLRDAVALTSALQADPDRRIPDPSLFANRPERDLKVSDAAVREIGNAERQAWCQAIEAAAHADSRVISAEGSAGDTWNQGAQASSNGFSGTWESTMVGLSGSTTVADANEARPEGSLSALTRHRSALPEAERVGREALDNALMRLGSRKGPTRKGLLVVDPRASGRLLGYLLGANNGRSIQQGRSFWAGSTGKPLFSPKLTVTDDPLLPAGLASRPFDGEGITARTLPIVEAGVVKNVYLDTFYARKLGLSPTSGSPSNRVVAPGKRSLAQILSDVPEAVYLTSWLGGNADGTTGDFSFGLRGHLVKDGKVGEPVGEMNVTGNLIALFSAIEEIGNDPWPWSSAVVPTLVFGGVEFSGA